MATRSSVLPRGFTLVEILVALVLIGLLVGTLLPSVVSQLGKGEINRLNEDLAAFSTGAATFRVDVSRWPSDAEDLTTRPLTTSADTFLTGTGTGVGSPYSAGLVAKWAGPYLQVGVVPLTGQPTALGGVILNRFGRTLWNGQYFFTVRATPITQADAHLLSSTVDGDTTVMDTLATAGRIRWRADTLIFLGSALQ